MREADREELGGADEADQEEDEEFDEDGDQGWGLDGFSDDGEE
jgi:hypothetical protein